MVGSLLLTFAYLASLNDDLYAVVTSKEGKLSSMIEGDSGWIPNYPDYPGGDFGHENSIKVGANQYFGHPLGRFTLGRLEEIMKAEYKAAGGTQSSGNIPGFRDEFPIKISFVDIAKIAGVMFDIRKSK